MVGTVQEPSSFRSLPSEFSVASWQEDWQIAFWGDNYQRLREVKRRHDPDCLFLVHHGVGSEDWSDDGFERKV
ncbi:BBE domain-containing protein [Bradyrhizobium prioriisuperbiae]|uniref:BBE domain-containing protein n=1 Tax=Bradyrhizobium prioriisuperbiae TaxID=2854389 RepID=UPI00389953FE